MKSKSVLIIGLGNISVGYDLIDDFSVLTHARAFSEDLRFKLVGGVDLSPRKRARFEKIYQLPSFHEINTAVSTLKPNLIVVATPTDSHLATIISIFESGTPEAILCEKPLSYKLNEAISIVELCETKECRLYVNFFRRVEPGIDKVRRRIKDGRIASPIKGVVWYSKGVANSGSHFIDILQNMFGKVSEIQLINVGRYFEKVDPEPDFQLNFEKGKVIFLASSSENFFFNEFKIVTPNGILRYEMGGSKIYWQGITNDVLFETYKTPDRQLKNLSGDFSRIQKYVAQALFQELSGDKTELCTGREALETQKILTKIQEMNFE